MTAILPIRHPVNGVGRLLALAFSKPVGDKDLFLAETNYHVLLQNLLAAAAVHLTAAATIRLCRPKNLQNSWSGWLAPWGRQWGGRQQQASWRRM